MSQLSNDVSALLNAAASDLGKATPNTGQGVQGEWPPQGDHDCFIVGVREVVTDIKIGGGAQAKGVEIQFQYLYQPSPSDPNFDPANPKPPLEFWGEKFRVVPNYEKVVLEEGMKTAMRISNDRFMGHLTKILRQPKENIPSAAAGYASVKQLIENGESRIMVRLRIDVRSTVNKKDPTKPNWINRTEFILDRLS